MTEVRKQLRRTRFFSPARGGDSAPPPYTADITAPGDVRSGIRKAAAGVAGRVEEVATAGASDYQRWLQETSSSKPGAALSVRPAESATQLNDQIAKLTAAFVELHGREPGAMDDAYWQAYRELLLAFRGRAGAPDATLPPDPGGGTGTGTGS